MTHYLLAGTRRRPGAEVRSHGPYATASLPTERAGVLEQATRAALAVEPASVRSRDRFVLHVFDGREVHRLVQTPRQVQDDGPVPALLRLVWHLDAPVLSAAVSLAVLCDLIADAQPAPDGPGLVVALAHQAAGIRPGPPGWLDLAAGGHDVLLGGGFRPELDDGTPRQVRHFAGTATLAQRTGGATTQVLSRLRGDRSGSADDRLTAMAVTFARDLAEGDLAPEEAGAWVREHLVAG
ncbi:MAG: hypothetical protein LH468_01280 [Nocardioides sp.]|nr:hypothetical protein [Nocardioides sp.]